MNKEKLKSLIPVIVLALLAVGSIIYSKIIEPKKSKEDSIEILTNYSDFYTVNSCLAIVSSYISSDNSDNLYLLLSDAYKKNNDITTSNVLSLFKDLKGSYTFRSSKMYYQIINDNVTKYFVKGYFQTDEVTEEIHEKELTYFIVYLDSKNGTYSIEPYTGEIFMEGDFNE